MLIFNSDAIRYITSNNNLWANYRIGRAAVRYGHHKIGFDIFWNLTENVSSEHLHFWLVCLKEMSEGESILLNDAENKISLVDRLDEAVLHYNKAIAALKVVLSPVSVILNVLYYFFLGGQHSIAQFTISSRIHEDSNGILAEFNTINSYLQYNVYSTAAGNCFYNSTKYERRISKTRLHYESNAEMY